MNIGKLMWAALTNKKDTTPQTESQTARTAGIDKTINHPGSRLSPAKLRSILEDAEGGNISEQHELFADIEESDSAIASNFDIRKRAVLTLDWSIAAPKDATPAEEKQHEFITGFFDGFGYLEDAMMDMMDAVGHGFSACEIHWQHYNNQWIIDKLSHTSPAWFKVHNNELRLQSRDNQDGAELWPLGWVIHKHKSRSTSLARAGLFRTLAWLYMFKYYSVRDFAEFLELYGMPIRIGKYGAGATKEEKRTLLRAVTEIGHNAAGIMPQGMEIELKDAASANKGDPFMQMINWCEKSAARLILGQTLTSGTDDATNTNALGNVHNEVRRDLLVSDVKQLSQTITEQIILPLLQVNFGDIDVKRIPRFVFDVSEYEDIKLYADSLPKLVEVGMPIPVSFAMKKLGIPEPQDDEPVLAFASPEQPQKQQAELKQVALTQSNTNVDTQALLDEQVALSADDKGFMQQLDPVIIQLVNTLATTNNYEEAAAALTQLYPELNNTEHERYMQNALVLADILGEHRAQR
ncbi:MAG: DUF935 domain-containing protein [Gammaproteobacteria bacterium]|nr:DUF935 domain-containing protein [Gammaproteobacteria bacterium]